MSDTTRIVREKVVYWSPVVSRGLLWFLIAAVTDFRTSAAKIIEKQAVGESLTPFEWWNMWAGVVLAGSIAVRIFLDQSVSRHVESKKQAGDTNHVKILG
jgi:hypothetical protein